MTNDETLDILRETDALLEGHFELRSGLHSGQFFQCANALMHPYAAEELCRALVLKYKEEAGDIGDVEAVISPALGGIIVGHEVARALGTPSIFAEKKDDKLLMRRFAIKPGKRYVVAEDVVTRGGRVQETIDIVVQAGGIVAAVLLIVNRSGGKAKFDFPMYSLLEMEPVTYELGSCPLCDEGKPLVHPGS